jgi:hypothetical protein
MVSEIIPAATDIVHEFYTNICKHGNDYFETWLHEKTIHVDTDLIRAITRTLRVPDSAYPWPAADIPFRSTIGGTLMITIKRSVN